MGMSSSDKRDGVRWRMDFGLDFRLCNSVCKVFENLRLEEGRSDSFTPPYLLALLTDC